MSCRVPNWFTVIVSKPHSLLLFVLHEASSDALWLVVQMPCSVFTGQAWVLHARDSFKDGQAWPPLACGVTMERVRFCLPPPHVALHALHEPQALTSQSVSGCVSEAAATTTPLLEPPEAPVTDCGVSTSSFSFAWSGAGNLHSPSTFTYPQLHLQSLKS